MKNLRNLLVVFVLTLVVGSLTFGIAQTRGGRGSQQSGERGFGGRGGGFLNSRILDQLNLTAEQRTQIETLQQNARTASEPYIEQLETIREQLQTATANGAFNEAAIREILAARARATIELEVIRLRTYAAIYNLLTAEQRALLEQIRERHDSFGGRGGRGN